MWIITSQSHRDLKTVNEKRAAKDYTVLLSPEFEVDGETYQVVLDGHHSFEAARRDEVEPEFNVATAQDHDAVSLLERGEIAQFLEAVYHDEDYRDIYTGEFAF